MCVESHIIKQNELSTLSLHLRLRPPPPCPPHLTVCFPPPDWATADGVGVEPGLWKTAGQTHTHNTIAHTRWERKREAIFIPCECVRALLLHPLVDSSIGSTSQPPSYCDGGADVVRRLGSLPFSCWLSPWWWFSALFFFFNPTNFPKFFPFKILATLMQTPSK